MGTVEYAGSVPTGAPAGSIVCDNISCYKATKDQIQPRFGFAFQATPRFVLRGGYGITSFLKATPTTSASPTRAPSSPSPTLTPPHPSPLTPRRASPTAPAHRSTPPTASLSPPSPTREPASVPGRSTPSPPSSRVQSHHRVRTLQQDLPRRLLRR